MPIKILMIMLIFSCHYAFSQGLGVKTYKEWKNEKIQLISSKINAIRLKIEAEKIKKTNLEPSTISYYEKMLSQEQWNIDIAKELSVTDYIALYLSKNQSKTKFQDAASNLSPSEVAEIIEAYSQSLPSPQSVLPTQASQNK